MGKPYILTHSINPSRFFMIDVYEELKDKRRLTEEALKTMRKPNHNVEFYRGQVKV
jgi:hypothetical protein